MWLENLILKRGEKKLEPYRVQAEHFKTSPGYLEYLPRIGSALKAARYWHGTGRYHYGHSTDTRYGNVNADTINDVLEAIVESDGLRPYSDPWIDSGGKTVSLATVRMHARLFARIHLQEHDQLLFELGSARYWYRLYVALVIVWILRDMKDFLWAARNVLKRSSFQKLQVWAGAIRKPKGKLVVTIEDVLEGNALGSDIEGNYPMLFGVADSGHKMLTTLPLVHAVEVRSLEPVRLNDLTHLEVPLAYVKQAEQFLADKGVPLEVLPLEYVDVYLSDAPLKKLAYV